MKSGKFVYGLIIAVVLLASVLNRPAPAQTATGGYCQRVKYCRVNCGELYAVCHNPVQRLTCVLAHVLCGTGFGR